MITCVFTSYHVLSCLITSYHVLSRLIMSYHVLSRLIMSYHGFHMLSCDNMCFLLCFWLSSHQPLNFVAFQPPLFCFMAVQPPHNSSLQGFLWLFSHHFFPMLTKLTLGCPSQKNLPRKMGEAPVVEINLGVLPSKNFSRRPSV